MPVMKSKPAATDDGMHETLDGLVAQLAALNARLEKLEAAVPAMPVAAAAPAAPSVAHAAVVEPGLVAQPSTAQPVSAAPADLADEFSDELLLVLSAAVAAYLGKRPHIRAIRLIGSGAWAQQGRVFVQASHQLNVPHDA